MSTSARSITATSYPADYLHNLDPLRIGEIHLAGFEDNPGPIDRYAQPAGARSGLGALPAGAGQIRQASHPDRSDRDIPALAVLLREAEKAQTMLETRHAVAA